MYGLQETQFRGFFHRAERKRGITGTNLLVFLERRLDNAVYRLGFANSRNQARQLVRHQHMLVNGRKVTIPSYFIKQGDRIEVHEKSRSIPQILDAMEAVARRGIPQWLDLDKTAFQGTVKSIPVREDLTMPIQEQLIVELYSK
jgi:small subunit ribosomal protein S4